MSVTVKTQMALFVEIPLELDDTELTIEDIEPLKNMTFDSIDDMDNLEKLAPLIDKAAIASTIHTDAMDYFLFMVNQLRAKYPRHKLGAELIPMVGASDKVIEI